MERKFGWVNFENETTRDEKHFQHSPQQHSSSTSSNVDSHTSQNTPFRVVGKNGLSTPVSVSKPEGFVFPCFTGWKPSTRKGPWNRSSSFTQRTNPPLKKKKLVWESQQSLDTGAFSTDYVWIDCSVMGSNWTSHPCLLFCHSHKNPSTRAHITLVAISSRCQRFVQYFNRTKRHRSIDIKISYCCQSADRLSSIPSMGR